MNKIPRSKQIRVKSPFVTRNGFLTTERKIVRSYQSEGERIYNFLQHREPDEIDMIIREMKPLAFEELIITALCDHGYAAYHGKAYTRDHGVDGWVVYNGEKHPIQIKRYNGTIPTELIKNFATLCNWYETEGLFIYTGKLTKKAYNYAGYMQMIGGTRLIDLLYREGNFYLVPEDALSEEDMNYVPLGSDSETDGNLYSVDKNMDFFSLDTYLQFLQKKGIRPHLFFVSCFSFFGVFCQMYWTLQYGFNVRYLTSFIFFLVTGLIFLIMSKSHKEDEYIILQGKQIPKKKFKKYSIATMIIMYLFLGLCEM